MRSTRTSVHVNTGTTERNLKWGGIKNGPGGILPLKFFEINTTETAKDASNFF